MNSHNRFGILTVLLGAVVLSWPALLAGELFARQYLQLSGYEGFAYIAVGFAIFVGMVVFSFLSFTELLLADRDAGLFTICVCAGVGLLCAVFSFGFGVRAFASGGGTIIGAWDILLAVGVVPVLLAGWTLLLDGGHTAQKS